MENIAWNLESEYPALQSANFRNDFLLASQLVEKIENATKTVRDVISKPKVSDPEHLKMLQEILVSYYRCWVTTYNMKVYIDCLLSVDATDKDASARDSEVESLMSRMNQATKPVLLFLNRADESTFEQLVTHPELQGFRFSWTQNRLRKDYLLTEPEETLIEALASPGHSAWGNLYDNLSGKLRCTLKYPDRNETVGLAQAHSLVFNSKEENRRVAWTAIQETWTEHREAAAAILNAIAGWRHEVYKKRSHSKPVHFLDEPLFNNRISRETLEAMVTACRMNLASLQKGLKSMAFLQGKPKLDPWDLLGPSPMTANSKNKTFSEALEIVSRAFGAADPAMGDFVKMMHSKQWIEGRILPNKTTGAYCTSFLKSLEPRVYMTFTGSNSDVVTLAHELGHAYHTWVMRDLSIPEQEYPSTLAETASVFGERLVGDYLISQAPSKQEKINFMWDEIEAATAFLLNINVRFEFEKNFYEKRKDRTQTADELSDLMEAAWKSWYGDTLTNYDRLFWAHKLHFSIVDNPFYNFPYTFGYLFSLSLYARQKQIGQPFMKTYVSILRDTGRMTAEDLIQKHLGEDIRQPAFWQKSLDLVIGKINDFSLLVSEGKLDH